MDMNDETCAVCGSPFFTEDNGVTHHASEDSVDGIDYFADADHVPYGEEHEPMSTFRCPTSPGPNNSELIGCGETFEAEPDDENLVDCPRCGLWFPASEPEVRCEKPETPKPAEQPAPNATRYRTPRTVRFGRLKVELRSWTNPSDNCGDRDVHQLRLVYDHKQRKGT